MDQERAVNKILRDMKLSGIATEGNEGLTRFFLNIAWVTGFEYFRRTELNHNKREIVQYNKDGVEIGRYDSIEGAARQLKIGRGTIDDILYGKTKGRRNTGEYFRYANGCGENINTDTGLSGVTEEAVGADDNKGKKT